MSQSRYERRRIVRGYLQEITDDSIRTLCYYYSQGCDDLTIILALRIDRRRLDEMKKLVALGLIEAGIALIGEE